MTPQIQEPAMKASAIVSSVVAASLGLGSLSAFAQPAPAWDGGHDRRAERQERRAERHEQRQEWRAQQRIQPAPAREQHWQARPHVPPSYEPRPQAYHQPQYHPQYQQRYEPRYRYSDRYRSAPYYAPRYAYGGAQHYYYVGDRLPYDYWRGMRVVNDWPAYSLYAPPYGHQWVQADTGEIILVALATGLIAHLLLTR
jgi:Ni/Co efflux regulator RcnB